jgi:hypothetical protein
MTKSALSPCPSCARHVRLSEPACPFCGAPLPRGFGEQTAPASPARRLNRAALHALRMSAIPLTLAACGGSAVLVDDAGEGDSATTHDGANGGSSGTASSGGSSTGGGSTSGSSGGFGDDGPGVVAAYGGFIPFDAGMTGSSSGGGGETDATEDAKPDHIFIAPPYGLPPIPPGN